MCCYLLFLLLAIVLQTLGRVFAVIVLFSVPHLHSFDSKAPEER